MFSQMRIRQVLVTVAALTVAHPLHAHGDDRISNLVHATETKTSHADQFGHVEKVGVGPVDLILIPAGGWGWEVYDSFMRRNAESYTCYAVTLPGYGGTDPLEMPEDGNYRRLPWCHSIQRAIQALVEKQGLKKPLLVGQGLLGDYHAMQFALDHADAVAGVVVISGSPRLDFTKPRATDDERAEYVTTTLVPMYEYQTAMQWSAGLIPATMLSTDEKRAGNLFAELSSVPRPTMLRYFLEVCTTDLTERLNKSNMHLLAIEALPPALVAAPAAVRKMVLERNPWIALQERGAPIKVEFVSNSQRFIIDDLPQAFDAAVAQFVKKVHNR